MTIYNFAYLYKLLIEWIFCNCNFTLKLLLNLQIHTISPLSNYLLKKESELTWTVADGTRRISAVLFSVPLRLELLQARSLRGVRPPTLSCSAALTSGRQGAACRTYSLVPVMQLEAVHF